MEEVKFYQSPASGYRCAESDNFDKYSLFIERAIDKIYIVRPQKMTSKNATFVDIQGKSWTIEREILRPSLLDVPLYPFSRPETNALIIFPYKIENDNADLYTPSEMRKLFP